MERTLENMMEELRLIKEERKSLADAVEVLDKKIGNLKREIEKYKLDNGLYHPMSDLNKYIGEAISEITLIERNKNGILETKYMCIDEIFEVDEYGYLYYSSYNGGIMHYDSNINKYVWHVYGIKTEHDFVGFLEIELWDFKFL